MPAAVKVKNKHTQPVILDADYLDDFLKAIAPQDVSSYFREIQVNVAENYREEEKKGIAHRSNNGAIMFLSENKPKYFTGKDNSQSTLDLFKIKPQELVKIVKELETNVDRQELGKIVKVGQLMQSLGKTSLHKVRNL